MTKITVQISAILLILVLAGCAHLGAQMQKTALPSGAPEVQEILNDLAANDTVLQSFRASGTITLTSPDLSGIKKFRDSSIAFQRPASLYAAGRKQLGPVLFRLTCYAKEFLLEVPTENQYYYQLHGEKIESIPFSVSPSDIAREMFLPEPWSELKPKLVQLKSYDQSTQTAIVVILDSGLFHRPHREITVTGRPWVITESKLLDKHGEAMAITTKSDYRELDGVRFAAKLDAEFPAENTRMTFEMRNVRPNMKLEKSLFDIKARAKELNLDLSKLAEENQKRKQQINLPGDTGSADPTPSSAQ